MNNKKISVAAFILIALVQLYIPAKMIIDKEAIIETGTEYKFRTAPVDPSDPFRGKYILLRFDANTIEIPKEADWDSGDIIYVYPATDNEGFAQIKAVSKEKLAGNKEFIKARVASVFEDSVSRLTIDYPFERYYMEESKAYDAELIYRQTLQDSNRVTYALVSIKDGDAVLKDVLIDGISIREIVKKQQKSKN
jgi:uncharacterized membrane-anchored protein